MKIIVAGDYCDHGRTSALIADSDFSSLFDEIKPVVENADFSIVNFEFPVVVNDAEPIEKFGPVLKGQRKAIDAIKYAGFNVCTLANNHILDQGEKACINTQTHLNEAFISTVGIGKDLDNAKRILYLESAGETIAIINCCEHEFSVASDDNAGANPLNPIQQYYAIYEARKHSDYVIIIVHGGHEMYQLPSPRMKETYRFFVDTGADAVINHHQHCYSGYEVYKSKPIFYGLGNFLFDWEGKRNSIWNEGYMVNLLFSKQKELSFELIPYTQSNEKPGVFMMNSEKKEAFEHKVNELNKIIGNDILLKERWVHFASSSLKTYQSIFQPYRGRIMKSLFFRGILPTCIDKHTKCQIKDFLECESHFDRLIYAIKKI